MARKKKTETGIKRIIETAKEYGMRYTARIDQDYDTFATMDNPVQHPIATRKTVHIEIDA